VAEMNARKAQEEYKKSLEFDLAKAWVRHANHAESALSAAFLKGYLAALSHCDVIVQEFGQKKDDASEYVHADVAEDIGKQIKELRNIT
jgi:hypothetical protein